ncbi:cupredoxin domain-containing protein [Crateriforma conspicua]|uniref:Methylamine utilization protein n=1 Tax=Crateriforma conspicua TaxID=2527996 RepID=A0A5C5Y756_9PLAN|nr:hypothetical protein [Crateriforma conspicua]TWT71140.1 hypothetical protein Pan14r_34500 [Crateriforma conspicua]
MTQPFFPSVENSALKIATSFCLPALLAAAACLSNVSALRAETGTLRMQLVYGGDPVKPAPIDVNKDVQFCGKHGLTNEALIVNPTNKGIKNAVVYVYTGRGTPDLPETEPAGANHVLANENCRFEPRYIIAQTGDKLTVTNPDPVGHNANLNFLRNDPQNFTIPTGQEKSVDLVEAEPAPIPVECNIHPWMKAYVVVLEHPFAAVSDEDGMIEIEGLPAGEELTFRIFHEAGRIDEVTIDGKSESWRRSRFEVEIEPGMNDMGTVTVPADALSGE